MHLVSHSTIAAMLQAITAEAVTPRTYCCVLRCIPEHFLTQAVLTYYPWVASNYSLIIYLNEMTGLSVFIYSFFLLVSLGLCVSGADLHYVCFLFSPCVILLSYGSLNYRSPSLSSSVFCHSTAWSNGLVSIAPKSSFLPPTVLIKSITCGDPASLQVVQKISVKFSINVLFPLFSHSLFISNSRPFSETSLCFLLLFLNKYCHCFCVTGLKTIL